MSPHIYQKKKALRLFQISSSELRHLAMAVIAAKYILYNIFFFNSNSFLYSMQELLVNFKSDVQSLLYLFHFSLSFLPISSTSALFTLSPGYAYFGAIDRFEVTRRVFNLSRRRDSFLPSSRERRGNLKSQ